MKLTLEWSDVQALRAAGVTRLAGSALEVDLEGLAARVAEDRRLERVHFDLVHPGESCRIGRVFDVVAPRVKVEGGEDFPGVVGALVRAGRGRTRAVGGVAVVVTDQQAENPGPLSIIDMAGPGAAMTEFARTENLVLSAWPAPGTGRSDYQAAVRLAGLRTAIALARATQAEVPDRVEVLEQVPRMPPELRHLPRIVYVFQIHSHQRPTGMDEGILYGDPVRRMLPTVVHPNEVLDGAIVRGFMPRNATTHAIQNHPVIRALYAEHGRTLWLAAVVLTVAQATEPERVRAATMTAGLVADVLAADGAIFTKIGGGAPHVDMAQAAAECEALGVKTTLIVEDMSTDGASEGMLLFNSPGLDALVNVGSSQQSLRLPPVDRAVGADDLPRLTGEVTINYTGLCGAVDQMGASRLVAVVE